ncbi:hypothetical protein like AT2G19090 [Hibiscus trionum]|uniref:Uncharacterized protein n=1 Tax=Hibiscus trionum TaxID=183268 RepID=A0A9W7J340_HIBTR|nr:hypothetical protein like AT2G19090 [Hibiscus trionum]
MGCSSSKLNDEEAVQLCKDRKNFIKQAVEQRSRFSYGHIAYIQSLKRVSAALRNYIEFEADEPRKLLLDSFITPSFTPLKKASPGSISVLPSSFSPAAIRSNPKSALKVNYLRSGGDPAVSVEERPPSPETVRIETYSPVHHFGIDSVFAMQSSPMNSSFFSYSPNDRPNLPPPSPQTSQWDFFWNPFSSLDYYGYAYQNSLDHGVMDDDIGGLRQVQEEEGIPDLEEDETDTKVNLAEENAKTSTNYGREEVTVEDVDEDEENEEETDSGSENEQEVRDLQVGAQTAGQVEVGTKEMVDVNNEAKEETPGFTVYVNQRPTSMEEVINDLKAQFIVVCDAANEVSVMLEANRVRYSSALNELTAMKMLNPVALLRSASSRSSSSRFLFNSSSSREAGYESSSDFSEDSCMFHGRHQSTLDRLFAWEKKLYEEVKSGEKVRIAYEKKSRQLRNQDVKGDDPFAVDKTRAAIRDLHTQLKVSIHSVEAISKRIETLRDEELQPQLLELVQGLARMWKVMAECHQAQKRTLDVAKALLAGTPSKLEAKLHPSISASEPHRLARSAANLEAEIRNWRACFQSWIASQRSYLHALSGWLLRCLRSDPDTSKLSFSPRRSNETPAIVGLCIKWSKFLDAVRETPVLDGLDFFAAGMGSLYAQQLREEPRFIPVGSKRFAASLPEELAKNMDLVVHEVEEVMTTEKLADVSTRVLCAGMSVAMSSLSEFAIASADGYAELVSQWATARLPQNPSASATGSGV